jgi:hypothetical protein
VSWGWKIVVVYSLFVIMTLSMVFYFMGQEVDLVSEDYYKQEIEYQDQMDKIANAKLLKQAVEFEYSAASRMVKINFPADHIEKGLKGNIHFYRPSNAAEDKNFQIVTGNEGEQQIGVGSLSKGFWKVKISWTCAGKDYYDERVVTL